jgi:hypothetical protein
MDFQKHPILLRHKRTLLLLAILSVIALVYGALESPVNPEASPKDQLRGLDTVSKRLFAGHLGNLFHFQYVGPFLWLTLPLLAWYRSRQKRFNELEHRVLLLLGPAVLILAIKGYFNYRYHLTLLPIWMLVFWYLATQLIALEQPSRKMLRAVLAVLVLLQAGNTFRHSPVFRPDPPVYTEFRDFESLPAGKAVGELSWMDIIPRVFKLYTGALLRNELPDYRYNRNFFKERRRSMLNFFELLDTTSSRVFVNNRPAVYYYTQAKGPYAWVGTDEIWLQNGYANLFEGRDDHTVREYLSDTLQCDLILSHVLYNPFHERLQPFLEKHTRLFFRDAYGNELYQIALDSQSVEPRPSHEN